MTTALQDRISRLVNRINALNDEEEPVFWIGPTNDAEIELVEEELGVRFPASFREFLRMTGGGGLESLCISGIPSDAPFQGFGTVFCDTTHYREEWVPFPLPNHLVVVERCPDDNEPFCLDTSRFDGDECPVVLYYLNSGKAEFIANNFLEFYERYLEPYFENGDNASS
jgi:SMI1-KNR4 cell-wall